MALRIRLEGDKKVGTTIGTTALKRQRSVSVAAQAAMEEAKERILVAGREDMIAGGNFGSPRWQTSLQGNVSGSGGRLILTISHRVFFWRVFEYGALIRPKTGDRLWIPLPWNPLKVWPRNYPGKLFRVRRKGKNDLLMGATGALYVGVKQVRLRRRFHLRPIIQRVSKQMPFLFRKWMRLANKGR